MSFLKNNPQRKWGQVLMAVCLIALPLGQPVAMAQENCNCLERVLSTQGHGEVKVKPDSLSLMVSTETTALTLNKARTQTNEKVARFIAAIKGLNLANLKLQTRNVQVYPEYSEAERGKLAKIIGYRSTNTLMVIVTGLKPEDLSDTGARIIDTALNSDVSNVGSISFYVDDLKAAQSQALDAAVRDALHNAEVMANAAKVTLTGVYTLEGAPQFSAPPMPMQNFSMNTRALPAAPPPPPLEAGETTVTSDISARFKF